MVVLASRRHDRRSVWLSARGALTCSQSRKDRRVLSSVLGGSRPVRLAHESVRTIAAVAAAVRYDSRMLRRLRRRNQRNKSARRRHRSPLRASFDRAGAGLASLVAASASMTQPAHAATDAKPKLADPDRFLASDFTYTYATSRRGIDACGNPLWGGKYYVPVIKTLGSSLGDECIDGDAMPSGAGSWAASDSDIWAPSISYFSGKYFLHYSAMKPGGQWCIGRATASSPMGPFSNQQEFACPPAGRWAIDPDVFVESSEVYLTYRDDAIASGVETGISAVKLNSDGHAIWGTRKDLLRSDLDVGWEGPTPSGVNVVENPSLVKFGSTYYLLFSGNHWNSKKYSIGIATCGSTPLPASRCKVIQSTSRPYFGYSGAGGLNPLRTLPDNKPGPGGMATTTTYKGTPSSQVVWHWWESNDNRRLRAGTLSRGTDGWFSVQGF